MNYGWQFYKNYYKPERDVKWHKDRTAENLQLQDLLVEEEDTDTVKKEKTAKQAAFFDRKNEKFKGVKTLENNHFHQGKQQILLKTTYPGLLIGTGYGHETGLQGEMELGFFFDYTTGLPTLSGSSVKGTLRSCFPNFNTQLPDLPSSDEELKKKLNMKPNAIQLAKAKAFSLYTYFHEPNRDYATKPLELKELDNKIIWLYAHKLELAIFEGLDVVGPFGKDTPQYLPMREHDVFHDTYISNIEKTLFEFDAITPHGKNPLKNPIPLAFLKVAPNVTFQFNFKLNDNGLSACRKIELFKHLLLQQGIGAKTNVGYGQFQ